MKKDLAVWDVLKSPVITEKSVWLREATEEDERGQILTFKVAREASKEQIRNAVEEVFGVKVAKIRTMSYKGKLKRQGRFEGRRAAWKKAYVTLKPGEPHVDYAEAI
ncbi:MAG: 50S ribosomal protein L23 [Pyrinomonadaceae bacterium]|nr:50S ribosomal protein L23 [Pyrinomonadaceae bacterium]